MRERERVALHRSSSKLYAHRSYLARSTYIKMSSKSIFHSLSATTGDGSVMEMSSLAGKVVYATNVASK